MLAPVFVSLDSLVAEEFVSPCLDVDPIGWVGFFASERGINITCVLATPRLKVC